MAAVEEIEVPVSQRPEWRGFAPLKAASEVSAVVGIKYAAQDAELLAYFYGAVRDGEVSLRVFLLATEVRRLFCPVASEQSLNRALDLGHCSLARFVQS